LREELAEAERCNDTGRVANYRWELEHLESQIAAAVGLSGRIRSSASHRERARLMVTKAIKAAIAKINRGNTSLGHHLISTVRTGNFCIYEPGPDRFAWLL
jgi:non-specific serine/threonine protein kinase